VAFVLDIHYCDKFLRVTRKGGFILFMVSEVLGYGHLAPSFLGLRNDGAKRIMAKGEIRQSYSHNDSQEAKMR
jgi:hypothetical protein